MITVRGTSRRAVLALGGALLASPILARSGPARVALLRGAPDGTVLLAGIEIALDRGWKTYWRVPGDSGMPPRFDFAASRNVAAVEVLYPAPARMSDGFGEILGYPETVVFPVRVTARSAQAPVTLEVTLHYGVCERLCLPLQDRLQATLGVASPPPADAARVAHALAQVPRAVEAGAAVSDVSFDAASGALSLVARLPSGPVTHVVVEGAPERPLPLPRIEPLGDGRMRASLRVEDTAPAQVLVTVVGASGAVEARVRLPV
jgi:DsbC/DsbD-like thiol-disulfide interchange protein